MSSRNRLLTPEARRMAPRIFQAMSAAAMECGAQGRGVTRVRDSLIKSLKAIPNADLDYAEIVDEEMLAPLKSFNQKCKVRIMVAVRFDSVRLIDNLPVKFPR
jgi:pantoate--beta-alanine ligase